MLIHYFKICVVGTFVDAVLAWEKQERERETEREEKLQYRNSVRNHANSDVALQCAARAKSAG